MAFSCTMLLGLMGGLLWQAALLKWELPCDYLTYSLVLYNFAVVGIAAIFYQKVRAAGGAWVWYGWMDGWVDGWMGGWMDGCRGMSVPL